MDENNLVPLPGIQLVEDNDQAPVKREAMCLTVIQLNNMDAGELADAMIESKFYGVPGHAAVRLSSRTRKLTFAWIPNP